MVQTFFSARKIWLAVLLITFLLILILPQKVTAQVLGQFNFVQCLSDESKRAGIDDATARANCLAKQQAYNEGDPDKLEENLDEAGKALDWVGGKILNVTNLVPAALSEIVVQLLSFGLWLAGILFNFIVNETIIKAAEGALGSNSSNALRPGIETAWKLIRDLINMSFIFILLYQSIQLILGRTNEAGKTIVKVAAVAILINFSIFITQVVVDASNIVAIGFYDAFTAVPGNAAASAAAQEEYGGGIANAYMNALGIQSAWEGISNGLNNLDTGKSSTTILSVNLLISLFLIVTIFIFVAAAIMLLVRYIMIIFLVILSPVAFAGIILPGTQQYTKQWWETLTGQAIFAPAFMIMTWVNLTLISSLYSNPERKGLEGLFESLVGGTASSITTEVIGAVFNFTLIIGTAVASLIIAKQFANRGGKGFGTLTNYMGGAALGGAAWAGRRTVGWAGQRALESKTLNLSKRAENSALWRAGLNLSERGATSTFDLRNNSIAKKTGAFSDFGEYTATKGFRQTIEEKAERKAKAAERIGGVSKETLEDIDNYEGAVFQAREYLRNAETDAEKLTGRKMLASAQKELTKSKKKAEAEKKAGRSVYAHEMERRRLGNLFLPSRAALEATSKVQKKLGGEDEKTQDKEKIAGLNDYFKGLLDAGDTSTLATELGGLSAGDFTKLKPEILQSEPAKELMKPADLKALAKRNDLSLDDRNKTIEAIRVHAVTAPDTDQKKQLRDFFLTPAGIDL